MNHASAKSKLWFPVIGVGASAGGLEPIESIVGNLKDGFDAAIVIVQHLSPDYKSKMPEILSRQTSANVVTVEDGTEVQRSFIYLHPPDSDVEIEAGSFRLRNRRQPESVSNRINRFFIAMANECGSNCGAIVLSGSGSDGSQGIRQVSDAGGLVLVQSPESAKFDSMPHAAISTGAADLIGSPVEIADWIVMFSQRGKSGLPLLDSKCDVNDDLANSNDESMLEVLDLLKRKCKIDFKAYKPNLIVRRIERRLRLSRQASIELYLQQLLRDDDELNLLCQDLLINVTRFFRDTEAFQSLKDHVIHELVSSAGDRPIRIWTPGCATGEEAFSIAMLMRETAEELGKDPQIKMFATDVHEQSLEKANRGEYSESELEGVSPQRITRFFEASANGFRVRPSLRRMVVFAPQNLLSDAAFSNLDLVVCRNTLIYFDVRAQRRALSLMHFGLRVGGYLFLGESETPGVLESDFVSLSQRWKIFRKDRSTYGSTIDLSQKRPKSLRVLSQSTARYGISSDRLILEGIETAAKGILPVTFVTTAQFKLLYSSPGAGRYLIKNTGKFEVTLPDLLIPGVATSVLAALQRHSRGSADNEVPLVINDILVDPGSALRGEVEIESQLVSVKVQRIELQNSSLTGFVVTITDQDRPKIRDQQSLAEEIHLSAVEVSARATLEEELRHTRESLHATIQELETSNEELQITNEKAITSNEELQSINEELHSVNEELYTVNIEHQSKIEELIELSADIENFLKASEVSMLFLDRQVRIRRMTPTAAKIFSLDESDVGRLLRNFHIPFAYPEIFDDINQVEKTGENCEVEIAHESGVRYLAKIIPYEVGGENRGTVLTFVSLQKLEDARRKIEIGESRFRGTFENAAVGIAHVGDDGKWLRVNQRLCDIIGFSKEEVLATDFQTVTHPDDLTADLERFQEIKAGHINQYRLRKRYIRKDGSVVPINLTVSRQEESQDAGTYFISVVEDASEEVGYQARLERAVVQRDQFLALLSQELRDPLSSIVASIEQIRELNQSEAAISELVHRLENDSGQMSKLVDNLLDTSRVARNIVEFNNERVDLVSVAKAAIENVRPLFDEKKQKLELEIESQPCLVVGDGLRLQQIVEHLLTNANRFTQEAGFCNVTIGCGRQNVVLSVRDNGKGLTAKESEVIFDMFGRGRDIEQIQGGLGVGLALVKMLVERHDGNIEVFSGGVEKGAEFRITLPIAGEKDEASSRNGTCE